MENLTKVKEAAKKLEAPLDQLGSIYEDLLKEYRATTLLKQKLAIARELTKIADVILRQEKKEKSRRLAEIEKMYEEINE